MTFVAELSVPTASADRYIDALCQDLAEIEMETTRDAAGALVSLQRDMGIARIDSTPDGLRVRAESEIERGISVLKFILGMRIEKIAIEERPQLEWTGYGADFTVLPSLREITVVRVEEVTPHMRRVTFAGTDIARFCGDEIHVRLLFPPKGLEKPEWPTPGKNGRPAWPPEDRRPATRVYTIRSFDADRQEVDIDFVLHGDHGIAGKWAATAEPGDLIGMMGPGGGEAEPALWYLIAGDETAIPAIARKLEAMSADAKGVAFIEVADTAEEQPLRVPPGVRLTWLHRNSLEPGQNTILADAVRRVVLPDSSEGCAFWLGAEAATAREIRTYWRDELKLPRKQISAVAYWHHEANKDVF